MRSLVVLFALVAVAVAAPAAEKRSIGHYAYSVPAAVSHQSRVDVVSSPAVVSTPVEYTSVVSEPVVTRTVVSPAVYAGGSAVSHQSRVDVHHTPAVVSAPVYASPVVAEHVVGPAVVDARSVYSAPVATVYSSSPVLSHQRHYGVHTSPVVSSVYSPTVYGSYW